MEITNEWLKEQSACVEGYKWSQGQTDRKLKPFINALLAGDHFDWANWVITRGMTYSQKMQYAIFAAEQVIKIYEDKYPSDSRPREAIEAARKCLNLTSTAAAYAANAAAYDANAAAKAAANAANAAAYAAAYAAYAANAAAYAANAAAKAAANAAAYAANAAANDRNKMHKIIIEYGVSLIEEAK